MIPLEIPVIDLALDDVSASSLVYKACSTVGFFYITNHGVPLNVIAECFAQSRNFFALPPDEKAKIRINNNGRGYSAPFAEKLDPSSSRSDARERFGMGREEVETGVPLRGPNQWPDPAKLPDFRSTMNTCFYHLVRLAQTRILRLAAMSLGLEPTAFDRYVQGSTSFLGLLHYFADASRPERGEFGAGAHTDFGLMALIATDGVNGLQVQIDDVWVDIPHLDGALVVNFGDMMERLTNGILKAALHRVINIHARERYSLTFFLEPLGNLPIEPHPALCKDTKQDLKPIRFSDYLLTKLRAVKAD